jgi:NADH:ubiquinone oxidoreductase subunit E
MLRNSDRILDHIRTTLNVGTGETTPDGRFTLVEAECLGSCGTAPMMQVGDEYYENLDEAKVDAILSSLK